MNLLLPSQWLTDQHHRIDTGVRGAMDGTGKALALIAALDLLRQHLYIEETFLFPPLAAEGLGMPVFVMQREHGQMWPLMQKLIASATKKNAAPDALRDPARALFQLLQIHNTKEEQIVYSAADQLVASGNASDLPPTLTTAVAPADWVCASAPH